MKTPSLRLHIVLRLSSVFKIFISYLLNRSRHIFRATFTACDHINNILCVVTNNYQKRNYSLVGSEQNVIVEQKDMTSLGYCFIGMMKLY